MRERDLGPKFKQLEQLELLRKKLGMPPNEEIAAMMQQFGPRIKLFYSREFSQNQEKVLEALSQSKVQFDLGLKKKRDSSTRPTICSIILLNRLGRGEDLVQQAVNGKNEIAFRFFYDLCTGAELVLAPMVVIGVPDDIAISTMSRMENFATLSTSEAAERYLLMQKRAGSYRESLTKDPSGFSLLEERLGGIKNNSQGLLSCQSREYALFGAELAGDLYRKLYEISAPLYKKE